MSKVEVLQSVKSPLSLVALMVLVAEALLFSLAQKASGPDFTLIVCGMILVIPSVILLLYSRPEMFSTQRQEPLSSAKLYDAFISVPMAAWNNKHLYDNSRKEILALRDLLKQECKFKKVFYAGVDIADVDDFEASDISVKDDFDAVRSSKLVILIYPEKMATGALVEIGAAMAREIPCIIFTPKRDTLPYMLQNADQAFDFIKIYEAEDSDKIHQLIRKHGSDIFPQNGA